MSDRKIHKCGHWIPPPVKKIVDEKRRIEYWLKQEKKICRLCHFRADQAKVEQVISQIPNLPEIVGISDQQVQYAEAIRARSIVQCQELITLADTTEDQKKDLYQKLATLQSLTNAKDLILRFRHKINRKIGKDVAQRDKRWLRILVRIPDAALEQLLKQRAEILRERATKPKAKKPNSPTEKPKSPTETIPPITEPSNVVVFKVPERFPNQTQAKPKKERKPARPRYSLATFRDREK